jgi:hypothetical protein
MYVLCENEICKTQNEYLLKNWLNYEKLYVNLTKRIRKKQFQVLFANTLKKGGLQCMVTETVMKSLCKSNTKNMKRSQKFT